MRSHGQKLCGLDARPERHAQLRFQLELGSCREKALQEAWRVHGGAAFCVDVLEKLPYDKDDETKTDYSEELTLLCRLWQEKLPDHEEVWRNRT